MTKRVPGQDAATELMWVDMSVAPGPALVWEEFAA